QRQVEVRPACPHVHPYAAAPGGQARAGAVLLLVVPPPAQEVLPGHLDVPVPAGAPGLLLLLGEGAVAPRAILTALLAEPRLATAPLHALHLEVGQRLLQARHRA